jgi:hypothetical protein
VAPLGFGNLEDPSIQTSAGGRVTRGDQSSMRDTPLIPTIVSTDRARGPRARPAASRALLRLRVGVQFLAAGVRSLRGGNHCDRGLQSEIQHGF